MASVWDFVGVIDFGTWGTAVAVCPFRQAFADDLASAYNNTLVSFPGGDAGVMNSKQHTAVMLDGAGIMLHFGKKAIERAKNPPAPPAGSALYKTFKLGLALKNRTPGVYWTVDSLANRMMEAEVTFPRGAEPAKAKLVTLIKHSLAASFERITAMLSEARVDKAARGGGPLIVHYVLTVPAGWDELAKAVMRRAAVDAGLPAAHTSFALEPECAVLSALASPHRVNLPAFGRNLAIFDAGGGTTDCIVSTLDEGPTLTEVVPGFCAEAGGSDIDRAFDALLGRIFGRGRPGPLNLFARASPASITKARSQFGDTAKLSIAHGLADLPVGIAEMIISLQSNGVDNAQIDASLDDFNSEIDRRGRRPVTIEDGVLIIPEPERLFDDVLARIVAEFRAHVDPIPVDKKPSSVLLVGGFADSPVVQAHLSAEFGRAGVRVTTIPAAWQAVVKGAILSALRPRAVRSRRMRLAFAHALTEPWDAALHDEHVAGITLADGATKGADVLQKIIGLGEEVDIDAERKVGTDLIAGRITSTLVTFRIYPLSRTVLGDDVFDDRVTAPRARRWVPHDGRPKAVGRVIPAGTPVMELAVPLPPLAAGLAVDNRIMRLYAKFGGTELMVRAEVVVDGVLLPEFSRAVPINYPVK